MTERLTDAELSNLRASFEVVVTVPTFTQVTTALEELIELRAKQPAEKPRPKHRAYYIAAHPFRITCDCETTFEDSIGYLDAVNTFAEHVLAERGKAKPLTAKQIDAACMAFNCYEDGDRPMLFHRMAKVARVWGLEVDDNRE
jgi:hypothetical protein